MRKGLINLLGRVHLPRLSDPNIDRSKMWTQAPSLPSILQCCLFRKRLSNRVSDRKLPSGSRRCKSISRSVGHSAASRRGAHLARRQEKRSETGRSFSRRGEDRPPARSRKPGTAEIWFTMIQLSVTINEQCSVSREGGRGGEKKERRKRENIGRENGEKERRKGKKIQRETFVMEPECAIDRASANRASCKFARIFESSLFISRGARKLRS